MVICSLKIYSGDFSFYEDVFMMNYIEDFSMEIYSGDFSFYEDAFRQKISIEYCSVGDLSLFKDLFMVICPLKIEVLEIYSFLKICSKIFVLRRFIQEIFPSEDVLMEIYLLKIEVWEIYPFLKIYSWKFVL